MTQSTLTTPGQLLANIPGILGFYPTESIVFMALEEDQGTYSLGPTLRFDINNMESTLVEALTTVDNKHNAVILAFAITADEGIDLDDVTVEIFKHADTLEAPVAGLWHTREIADGEPWEMMNMESVGEVPGIPAFPEIPPAWKYGYIDSIVTAISMEPYIREGRLPGYDRDEAHAPLHMRNPHIDAETLKLTQQQAHHAAAIMYEKSTLTNPRYGYGLEQLLKECEEVIFRATTYGFDAADSCLHDVNVLGYASMTMANTYVRDLTAATYLDHPEETAAIMLAVSQSFTGTIRNNALCIYAAAQIKRGLPMYAGMALSASNDADRTHSLTTLMLQCYLNGLAAQCVGNIYHGSEQARSHHDRQRADKQTGEKKGKAKRPDFDDAA